MMIQVSNTKNIINKVTEMVKPKVSKLHLVLTEFSYNSEFEGKKTLIK